MKILLAEDTKDLNRALCAVLNHEGYDVDPAFDGEEVIEHIERDSYDCIVLDIMMPKKDGIQALKEIREKNIITPVIMLTAKSEVDDRVAGLDAGADDYLTKPFAMKELLARVRALTRRKAEYGEGDLKFNDVTLNAQTFELASENSVRLSVKEFELMQLLIINRDHSVSAEYILGNVWSREPDARPDTVWLYISYLKRKLRAVASETQIAGDENNGYILSVKR
ncbi:MAG: response regulator transcription factor [Ruminococcus sp.]|nr:response regulator transcription factor [Ruminococcus sp.]